MLETFSSLPTFLRIICGSSMPMVLFFNAWIGYRFSQEGQFFRLGSGNFS